MLAVDWEKANAKGGFEPAVKRSAYRAERASQELKSNAELAANKRAKLYLIGRAAPLADEVNVGDKLDSVWKVVSVDPDERGLISVLTVETN